MIRKVFRHGNKRMTVSIADNCLAMVSYFENDTMVSNQVMHVKPEEQDRFFIDCETFLSVVSNDSDQPSETNG
jgi:hypothetical protein